MLQSIRLSRSLRFGAALLALTVAAGCRGITDNDDEPDIAAVRLTIGGAQTVTINRETGAQSGAVTLPVGTTTIAAVALNASGQVEPLVTAADFELRIAPVTTNVTFVRTGPFAGTLTRTASGAATVRVSLYHTGEGHEDFGPHNLTFN